MEMFMEWTESDRSFRLWEFRVGHSQLLIRSARDRGVEGDVNLDLIFKGVFFLEVPDWFRGLSFRDATPAETGKLESRTGVLQSKEGRFYTLLSEGRTYFVGAAIVAA